MSEWGYAEGYEYAHDNPNYASSMRCLPEGLNNSYYHPTEQGLEKRFKERLDYIQTLKKK